MPYNRSNNNRYKSDNRHQEEVVIKTPYAFVPLSKDIFYPKWAKFIYQDIPFRDSVSGSISFEITSKTPIFVRNGQKSQEKDSSFSKDPDGSFFIPGSSIKGEIESVLRIMSFSRIGQFTDSRFGNRNLSDPNYRNHMSDVHCGWMRLTPGGAIIVDCDSPGRISLERIDEKFNTTFASFVKNKANFKDDYNRTAKKKYDLLNKGVPLKGHFVKDNIVSERMSHNPKDKREFVTFSKDISKGKAGTIVFTGQPGVREQKPDNKTGILKWKGKYFEFVFFDNDDTLERPVPQPVFKDFESIHSVSPDYINFRKQELYSGKEIPVFFILDKDKETILSIGLSYLYKYPYRKSIKEAIPLNHKDKATMDLCDCIFGFTGDNSCKGRVQFHHAFATNNPLAMNEQIFRMSQPRASYYPFYVEKGKTWDNADSISGHKRYPIRLGTPLPSPKGTKDMESSVRMLPKGTVFKETVTFHNLKPVELGALLSAITFHGNEKTCYHSLGFGKPLGYGAVRVTNLLLTGNDVKNLPLESPIEYLREYERIMCQFKPNWLQTPQIKELFLMAQGIPSGMENSFEYMDLESKGFVNIKNAHKSLEPFSQRVHKESFVVPALNKD